MRKGAGIQDDEIDPFVACLLYPVNQIVFGVALVGDELVSQVIRQHFAAFFDVLEAVGTIDVGLAGAEQVQICAVYKENASHFQFMPTRLPKMAAILTLFGDVDATFVANGK